MRQRHVRRAQRVRRALGVRVVLGVQGLESLVLRAGGVRRQVHGDHLSQVAAVVGRRRVLPFDGVDGGRGVETRRGRGHGFGLDAGPGWTMGARLLDVVRRSRSAGDSGTRSSAVHPVGAAVHVGVEGRRVRVHLTHVVPGVRARHMTGVAVVLLVGRGVVHHVPVRHVPVRHLLIHVSTHDLLSADTSRSRTPSQLRLRVPQHASGRQRILVFLQQSLRLATWSVLVVRVFLHVHGSQTLGLVYERSLLRLTQQLPLSSETLRDLRVMHLRVLLSHLPSLAARPHHERVHRPLHPIHILVLTGIVVVVGRRAVVMLGLL